MMVICIMRRGLGIEALELTHSDRLDIMCN